MAAVVVLRFGAQFIAGLGLAREMPAKAVTGLDGGQVIELRAAAPGRPVVVNLWASRCGPCLQEMPALAAAQHPEAEVGFLFVNQGESAAAVNVHPVNVHLVRQGLPLREVLLDPGSKLGPAVGSRGLPTTFCCDNHGRQVEAHFCVLKAAALEVHLRHLRHLCHLHHLRHLCHLRRLHHLHDLH